MRPILLPFTNIFLLFAMPLSLGADSPVIPSEKEYDLSYVPPSATHMLRQEREKHELNEMESFKKIIQDAVASKKKRAGIVRAKRKKNLDKKVNNNSMQTALAAIVQQHVISQEIIDIIEKQLNDPELQEKKISMHIKKMPTKDALTVISKSAGIPLVVDADVTGTVQELKLNEIPITAALHSILMSNEPRLALIKDFGVWRVLKMQTARELFIGMAAREREKDFAAAVLSMRYAKWNDALKNRIEKLWQGITQANTDKNNVYLIFDDVNRKIFFKARKGQVEDFSHYLHEFDVKIPQIRIDARVVIASKDFEEALGFNWSGVYNRRASVKHFDFVGVGPVDKTTGNGSDKNTNFNDIIGWSLNFIPSNIKTTLAKLPFVFGNNDMNTKRLSLELNAAENRGEVQTILKPSLLIHNEESAEILVGQELPHQTRLDETIESRLTNITTVNYKDIGMKIRVKPAVAPDHQAVFLDIYVENSMVAKPEFLLIQGDAIGTPNSSFNYTIKTSRSQNRVLLRSGQTTLISGLITHAKSKDTSGVPGLKDIPVVGWFFKGSRRFTSDEQLLIFITPTLVEA